MALSFAAECNLEEILWRKIWKYISIDLKIFIPFDPAIAPYELEEKSKIKNKDLFKKIKIKIITIKDVLK